MPDLTLTAHVTRNQLSLGDLHINDHTNFYIAQENFLSQQVSWNKQQVTSIFLDGSVTVARSLQTVNENITVEVLGDTTADLYTNIQTLVQAFKQDYFQLKVTTNSQLITYQCEAADYSVTWQGVRMIANQVQVVLSVPRQPNPLVGAF